MQPLDPRQVQGITPILKHLLLVMLHARNVTCRVCHERRLLVKCQGELVIFTPAILAEKPDPGLGVIQPGIEGCGLTGSSSRLQVQPGYLHSLLLVLNQVESMIQLIDSREKTLVITGVKSLQQ